MSLHLWLWLGVVATGSARVVRQPDGIISIITELEPEKASVTYLQDEDVPAKRRSPVVVEDSTYPPLSEGEFRVRSTKIRVVNPETGFKVVHEAAGSPATSGVDEDRSVKPSQVSERRNEINAEPANDFKIIYPSRSKYFSDDDDDDDDDAKSFKDNNEFRSSYQRQRKPGNYGYQTPKSDNMVRTDKTTRIRTNDGPPEVIRETILRPVTQEDEINVDALKKKHGKSGRFVRYRSQDPVLDTDDSDRHITPRVKNYSPKANKVGQYGTYRSRNPDINSDNDRRFRTSKLPVFKPRPVVDEVVEDSSGRGELVESNIPRKNKKEYSTSTVVRFPDGYAQDNEKRVESSSNYKTSSNSRDNYETPATVQPDYNVDRKLERKEFHGPNAKRRVEEVQPVPQESVYVSSGVDDTLADDGGVIYPVDGYEGDIGVAGHAGVGGGYGGGFEKEKHFEKEKGKHYVAEHQAAHGAKGQKGHNNEESFSKGKSEQHGHDENKGYSKEHEGEKKSHLDKSSQFAAGHQAAEGAKASDFHREKGHRKGHKKSGFRTVHHKDEYNKKEEFFDEEHDTGGVHKEGHKKEEHSDEHGGKEKKAYLDAGHHDASRGHEGGHDKGHGYSQQAGHQKEKAHSGHYGHEEDYGKKSGHKEGEVHGHSELGGGYHG